MTVQIDVGEDVVQIGPVDVAGLAERQIAQVQIERGYLVVRAFSSRADEPLGTIGEAARVAVIEISSGHSASTRSRRSAHGS